MGSMFAFPGCQTLIIANILPYARRKKVNTRADGTLAKISKFLSRSPCLPLHPVTMRNTISFLIGPLSLNKSCGFWMAMCYGCRSALGLMLPLLLLVLSAFVTRKYETHTLICTRLDAYFLS
ncbi:MAG: hypothetical protein J3R72DRAFT_143203 [Linnemannia gamsii]|nr:MAG: hypothetical protein J3R72DRAFT_143203 [Linnemannia gamsii]